MVVGLGAGADHRRDRHRHAAAPGSRAAPASSGRCSTCRRWRRRWPRTIAFVYLFKPGTGPVNTLPRRRSASTGRSGSTRPTWSKPSLVLLGLWGIGDLMIIFLAALLDVPAEPATRRPRLDGANAWQRFRYVTLPSISPVILFAAITGVIYTLQYFTQAAVAASHRQRPGHHRRRHLHRLRLSRGLDLHLPAVAVRGRLPLQPARVRQRAWPWCCSWSRSAVTLVLLRRSKAFAGEAT